MSILAFSVLKFSVAHPLRACSVMLAAGAFAVASGAVSRARLARGRAPYVPTPKSVVDRMLEIAKVRPGDFLIDLGSGDGRIVVTAAKQFGILGFGVDLNPIRLNEANENARKAGVTDKVAFYQQDLSKTDLAQASVITMYLLPRMILGLRPKLLELKPGTRIVSHDYSMGEWRADHHEKVAFKRGSGGSSDIYSWIVPAKVAGVWESQLRVCGKLIDCTFTLEQQFQVISGLAQTSERNLKLENAKIDGDQLQFALTLGIDGVPTTLSFRGRVQGDVLSGTATLMGPRRNEQFNWTAVRQAALRAETE